MPYYMKVQIMGLAMNIANTYGLGIATWETVYALQLTLLPS